MHVILWSCTVTLLAVILSFVAALAGVLLSRTKRWWMALFFLWPMALLLILNRRTYAIEMSPWAGWCLEGRREFLLLGMVYPCLLFLLHGRLKETGQRKTVAGLALATCAVFSWLPLLQPVIHYPKQSQLANRWAPHNICLQSTSYNCGPAASVTVLKYRGVDAEESVFATEAFTSAISGTGIGDLVRVMHKRYGCHPQVIYDPSMATLARHTPTLAVISHSLLADHYVAVLEVNTQFVTVGDPLDGRRRMSRQAFKERYRGISLVWP